MTLARKSPMRLCGRRHDSEQDALSSPAGTENPDWVRRCPDPECGKWHARPAPGPRAGLARSAGIRSVSRKREAENRQRRQVITALLGAERPMCARPGCTRLADDVHEPLTRARGGSITDPSNMVPLCRKDHDALTFRPESELTWAYEAGRLRHSWNGAA